MNTTVNVENLRDSLIDNEMERDMRDFIVYVYNFIIVFIYGLVSGKINGIYRHLSGVQLNRVGYIRKLPEILMLSYILLAYCGAYSIYCNLIAVPVSSICTVTLYIISNTAGRWIEGLGDSEEDLNKMQKVSMVLNNTLVAIGVLIAASIIWGYDIVYSNETYKFMYTVIASIILMTAIYLRSKLDAQICLNGDFNYIENNLTFKSSSY